MTTSTGVQAGWYGDPANPTELRFWDGMAWTGHTASVEAINAAATPGFSPSMPFGPVGMQPLHGRPAPQPTGAHPDDVVHWLIPTGRPWQTIVAGYVGIVTLFAWFLGPVSIGVGVAGLRAAKRTRSHGRGRAIFAIVVGVPATLAAIIVAFVAFRSS
jgi:hypothetical protein